MIHGNSDVDIVLGINIEDLEEEVSSNFNGKAGLRKHISQFCKWLDDAVSQPIETKASIFGTRSVPYKIN